MSGSSIHGSNNIAIQGSLTAGGNITINNVSYGSAAHFSHSVLFLRIETASDGLWAQLYLQTQHEALRERAQALLLQPVRLDATEQLWTAVNQFQDWRRGTENARYTYGGRSSAAAEQWLGALIHMQMFPDDIGQLIGHFIVALQAHKIDELLLVISSPVEAVRNLPWEMVIDRLSGTVPVLRLQGFGLVRSQEVGLGGFQMGLGGDVPAAPLKLLFVTALPENMDERAKQLAMEYEQQQLIAAVGHLEATGDRRPRMVIEFLDVASLEEIEHALRERDHDVLHISGHGSYDEKIQRGVLHLEDANGDHLQVAPSELAEILAGFKRLKLVVLSACETSVAGAEGMADGLAGSGIPAVVAMRFAITDSGAREFTTEFYRMLVQGKTITESLAAARFQLWNQVQQARQAQPNQDHLAEWFTPTLHLNQYVTRLVNASIYDFPKLFYPHSTFTREAHTRLIGEGFIGRKRQRIHMRRTLQAGDGGRRPKQHLCLVGMGGIGKTTLAEAFAYNYGNHSHKVIIWRGAGHISEMGILQGIIHHYKQWHKLQEAPELEARIQDGNSSPVERLEHLLRNCFHHESVILIFDNFEDLQAQEDHSAAGTILDDAVREMLTHLLLRAPAGVHVIVTTRYRVLGLPSTLVPIFLGRLSLAEQYRLMNLSPVLSKIPHADRERVYARLDGLPRAYDYLAGLAQHDAQFSWTNLERDLGQVQGEVFMNLMLERIYDYLPDDLKRLFCTASVFFLRTPIAALVAVAGLDEDALLGQLSRLQDWSLVLLDEVGRTFEVHALTREWVAFKGHLSQAERHRVAFVAGCYHRDQPTWADEEIAISYFELAEDWEAFAKASLRLQGFYQRIGRYGRARELCLAILDRQVAALHQGEALGGIGTSLHHEGRFGEALDYLQRSLKIGEEIGDRAGEGATLNNISQIYDARGDYATALDYLQRSLRIREEIGDQAGEGKTLSNLGSIAYAQGDYKTALNYLRRSLRIMEEIGDRAGQGATLNNISQIYDVQGDYATALDYLQRSLKIQEEIGDRAGEGATLGNIGSIAHAQGDYATALDYMGQSLKILQEIGNKHGESVALNNIGQIYRAQGDYQEALRYAALDLKICQEIGDKAGMATTLHNMGAMLLEQGGIEEALLPLIQAFAILQKIGSPNAKTTMGYLEHIVKQLGEARVKELLAAGGFALGE